MSIICGTDLSPASGGALEVAIALAAMQAEGQRELVLVHVVDPELGGTAAEKERFLEDARNGLDRQAQETPHPGVTLRAELVLGPPDQTLIGFADTEGSPLIVVAARSRDSSLLRLGTTAERVIAATHVPVLVVRDPAPWLAFARRERPLRVMLGIDDSATCDLGIQWTHALGERGPLEVVLGAIYYPDDAAEHYGLPRNSMVDSHPEIERLMARDLLRRFGSVDSGTRVTARPHHGLGRIGDHLIELAREERVDAIVIGTHQKTGLGRLGSVSSVIVNDASQSVVCIPPQAQIPLKTVPVIRGALVATDLSQFSNRAVAYAFALSSGSPDAEVHLVHVVKEGEQVDDAEITRQLYALVPSGATQRVIVHVVRGDDAATAIAQTAARLGADVICIASHGRSGFTRALVGSVADRLLRATRLPVLVLRPT